MLATVRVEYLFSRACPSHEEGLDLLQVAARAAQAALDLLVVEITSNRHAEERRFPGSPTYLIEGRDLVAPAHGIAFTFDACRAYARPGGRIGPLPHHDDLVAALLAAQTQEPIA